MRCKVGDLAVIISARIPENIGRLVNVVRPYRGEKWVTNMVGRPAFAADSQGRARMTQQATIEDRNLRPIRWNDSKDARDVTVSKGVTA